jgi:hypothetical protein
MSIDANRQNREILAEAASGIPIVGKVLAVIIRQKRWRVLGWIAGAVFLFVIYPLVVPIVAAALINMGLLAGLQAPYAESVRKALSVDKAAIDAERENNQRLDYFQMVDALTNANEERTFAISVQPYQRMRFRTSDVQLVTQTKTCAIPPEFLKKGVKIFGLEVGDVQLGDIRNDGTDATFEVTRDQWAHMIPRLDAGRLKISLLPVDGLRRITCDELKANVRVTIEVFKDLLAAQ